MHGNPVEMVPETRQETSDAGLVRSTLHKTWHQMLRARGVSRRRRRKARRNDAGHRISPKLAVRIATPSPPSPGATHEGRGSETYDKANMRDQ